MRCAKCVQISWFFYTKTRKIFNKQIIQEICLFIFSVRRYSSHHTPPPSSPPTLLPRTLLPLVIVGGRAVNRMNFVRTAGVVASAKETATRKIRKIKMRKSKRNRRNRAWKVQISVTANYLSRSAQGVVTRLFCCVVSPLWFRRPLLFGQHFPK